MKPETKKQYDTHMDLLRIIASFFVVMIHSTLDSADGVFYNSLARFSVPVFVILSGYYMLAKDIPLPRLLGKIGKLFSLVLIWSCIYYANPATRGVAKVENVMDAVTCLLTQPFHIWYLYAAMGLYLFTPVLRVFAGHADRGQYRYALGLTFLFGSVLTIAARIDGLPLLPQLLEMTKLPYAMGFFCLYLLGGYWRRFGTENRTGLLLAGIAGTVFTATASLTLYSLGISYTPLHSFFAPGVILSAAGTFALADRLKGMKPHPAIRELSECTLGIYLVHPYVTFLIPDFYGFLRETLPDMLYTPVRTAVCFGIAAAAVFLLRKLPVVNKILF